MDELVSSSNEISVKMYDSNKIFCCFRPELDNYICPEVHGKTLAQIWNGTEYKEDDTESAKDWSSLKILRNST